MKQRKIVLIAITSISSLILSASVSLADSTGIITGSTVRMRQNPNTSSSILTNLDENDKVNVIQKEGEWYKISFEGKEGYVFGEYLNVKDEVEEAANKEESTKEQEEAKETLASEDETKEIAIKENSKQKTTDSSKLYSLPLLSSIPTGEVKKDTEVVVMQVLNNWIYIKYNNTTGWLPKQNFQEKKNIQEDSAIEEEDKAEDKQEETNATLETPKTPETTSSSVKTGYVNVENANVRKKPTTDSEHIITLTLNKEVSIIGEEDNWYKIQVGEKEGYIYKKLVSDEKVKETTSRSSEDRMKNEVKTENIKTDYEENTSDVTGSEIVEYAMNFIGCKYVSGGAGPSTFDCSGFTMYVYKHFGYSLSHSSKVQAVTGVEVDESELQLGDILIYKDDANSQIGHVAIYIGNGKFVHAANPKKGVVTESMSNSYYSARYVTARRII